MLLSFFIIPILVYMALKALVMERDFFKRRHKIEIHARSKSSINTTYTARYRIGFVSSYPPTKCGIADYSAKLFQELKRALDIVLLADRPERTNGITDLNCERLWKRNSYSYIFLLFKSIISQKIDIVHIQHEYLLYGEPYHSGLIPFLLILLQIARKKVIITMHSIVPLSSLNGAFFDKYGIGKNFALVKRIGTITVTRLLGIFSNKIIVHNSLSKEVLVSDYGFDKTKVCIIPHGVAINDTKISQKVAKQELDLADFNIVLFFGFMKPGKGLKHLLKAFPRILQKNRKIKLIVAGGIHPNLNKTKGYFKNIQNLIEELNIKKSIILTKGYISEDLMEKYIIASDVCVMPYTQDEIISASGVLNAFVSYGKPVVATSVYQTGNLTNKVNALIVNRNDSEAIATAIMRLISNPWLRKRIGNSLHEMGKKNNWKKISEKTIELYEELDKANRKMR